MKQQTKPTLLLPILALSADLSAFLMILISRTYHARGFFVLLALLLLISGLIMGVISLANGKKQARKLYYILAIIAIIIPTVPIAYVAYIVIGLMTGLISLM